MISRDLRIEGIDPEGWAHLLSSLLPPPGGDPEPQPLSSWGPLSRFTQESGPARQSTTALSRRPAALVLLRGERILRILSLGGGTLPAEELPSASQEDLRALRRRLGLPFVAALDVEALPGLWAEAQSAVNLEEDFVAQELAMVRVFREALGRSVRVDPRLFGRIPLPSAALLQKTFNTLLPDGRSLIFYLVEGGRVWTSLIAVKQAGDIVLVTSHAAIADKVRFSSVRDARAVNQAVAERFAPPHIGLFLPLRTWHELVAGDRSAIARALPGRQAVLDPAPPWLLALVGAGTMAEAATRSVRFAGKLLAASGLGARFLPGGTEAAERLVQTVSNPLEALGLDPWDLLRWSRDWVRRIVLEREGLGRG
jgi:hypothetical protein